MQMATKYVAPQIYAWAMEQVKGSALLPRDVLTMMLSQRLYAFILPSGRILYPMPGRADVSQSLDVIAAEPGQGLIRGENGWEAYNPPSATGSGAWQLLSDVDIAVTGPLTEIVTDVSIWSRVWIIGIDTTTSSSTRRIAQISYDGGATWLADSQYRSLSSSGTFQYVNDSNRLHENNSASARAFSTILDCLRLPGVPKPSLGIYGSSPFTLIGGFTGDPASPVTHIRLSPEAGGSVTFNGGRFIILGS